MYLAEHGSTAGTRARAKVQSGEQILHCLTSRHRQHSGLFCSPQRPEQGHAPLQHTYLQQTPGWLKDAWTTQAVTLVSVAGKHELGANKAVNRPMRCRCMGCSRAHYVRAHLDMSPYRACLRREYEALRHMQRTSAALACCLHDKTASRAARR
jgi:hypothetical protein